MRPKRPEVGIASSVSLLPAAILVEYRKLSKEGVITGLLQAEASTSQSLLVIMANVKLIRFIVALVLLIRP
jgi:hypothetical protein